MPCRSDRMEPNAQEIEFRGWPKIGRESPFRVTITEKINGTNAGIIIDEDNKIIGAQSRKRLITPEDDNFGFARWVQDHEEELSTMGHGYHYGEWAGEGIQKNPHNLNGKQLFLFNTFRWNPDNPNRPDCCSVVPILFDGMMDTGTIPFLLQRLQKKGKVEGTTPEGLVVYYHSMRSYTKHTIVSPNGKWCKE